MPIESGANNQHEAVPDFLADKWSLHKQEEADKSVEQLRGEGEKIPETKTDRIEAHFRRIDRALEHKPDYLIEQVRERLHNEYVINLQTEEGTEDAEKIDKLVQGLFESQMEVLRQQGHGAALEQYGEKPRGEDYNKFKSEIIGKQLEQTRTLNIWIDYLASNEGKAYPTWFKYTALRSLGKMGSRDRDTGSYTRRSSTTLDPFPELSREALAKTLDIFHQHETGILKQNPEVSDQELLNHLETYAERGDFARLYAYFQNEIEQIRRDREQSEGVAGEWKVFKQGSNPEELAKALEGKGTEWCIAGLDVAKSYLNQGDIWVYFSEDKSHNPVDPRACVRLIDGKIAEVRGVADEAQNLETQFVDIAREKYKEFPGGEQYEKKASDMKQLTSIYKSQEAGHPLTADDLKFLYEIDSSIQGFGYGRDPRISELRSTRDPEVDMPLIFECEPAQIARSVAEINESTKAYVGPTVETRINQQTGQAEILEEYKGIFQKLAHVEHIYTSFPEGRIQRTVEIGGMAVEQIKQELRERNINISTYAEDMLDSKDFTTLENPEEIDLVRLKVGDLGFTQYATTDEIYTRAKELGLELCPAEVGPHQRLKDLGQPLDDWYRIAMKQILGRYGSPHVFYLGRRDDGLWLDVDSVGPDYKWNPGNEFVFRLRKASQET